MPLKPRPQITQPADPSYRLIALTHGQVAKVDTEDYDWLMQWNWCANLNKKSASWYAERWDINEKRKKISMHRAVMKAPIGVLVDHKNHDTLDNRKSELRIATRSQNLCNSRKKTNNTSGFKGVSWHKGTQRWAANIGIDNKQIFLGRFDKPEDAHAAYVSAALRIHGEFACPR